VSASTSMVSSPLGVFSVTWKAFTCRPRTPLRPIAGAQNAQARAAPSGNRTWNLAALRTGRALRALKVRRAEGPLPSRATVVEEAHTKAISAGSGCDGVL